MIVEHRGDVFGNARHAARTDGLNAGLLDRIEYAASLRIARHMLAVNDGIVTGQTQRHRVCMSAYDRGFARREFSRRLGKARLAGGEPRTLGGKRHFNFRFARDRAKATRHRAFERLGRGFLARKFAFDVAGRHLFRWVSSRWFWIDF